MFRESVQRLSEASTFVIFTRKRRCETATCVFILPFHWRFCSIFFRKKKIHEIMWKEIKMLCREGRTSVNVLPISKALSSLDWNFVVCVFLFSVHLTHRVFIELWSELGGTVCACVKQHTTTFTYRPNHTTIHWMPTTWYVHVFNPLGIFDSKLV